MRDPWHTGQFESWTWVNATQVELTAGDHLLEFRYREAGAGLDLIALIPSGLEPELPEP